MLNPSNPSPTHQFLGFFFRGVAGLIQEEIEAASALWHVNVFSLVHVNVFSFFSHAEVGNALWFSLIDLQAISDESARDMVVKDVLVDDDDL